MGKLNDVELRLDRVGYQFYLSTKPFSLNGNPPMYHIVPKSGKSVTGADIIHLENAEDIRRFLVTRKAANAARTPEDAAKIMQEGGF